MKIGLYKVKDKNVSKILNAYYSATGITPKYMDLFSEEKSTALCVQKSASMHVEMTKFYGDDIIYMKCDNAKKNLETLINASKSIIGIDGLVTRLTRKDIFNAYDDIIINIGDEDEFPTSIFDIIISEEKGHGVEGIFEEASDSESGEKEINVSEEKVKNFFVQKMCKKELSKEELDERFKSREHNRNKIFVGKKVFSIIKNLSGEEELVREALAEKEETVENEESKSSEKLESTVNRITASYEGSAGNSQYRHRWINLDDIQEALSNLRAAS